jgi:hypothetical protein
MKFLAFAAAALLVASPVFAVQQQRARAGGDPDLDLSVRPRGEVKLAQADLDDDVYLPGLTERAGVESAADMAGYMGEGGPLEEIVYPPCSATVTDRCIQLSDRSGR